MAKADSASKKNTSSPGPVNVKAVKPVILSENDIYNISNNKNSLTRTIYEKLMSMFMSNELIPGQLLNRRKLAADLGVSVAPVLEALVQLELEGFIETVPRKGTIVCPVREHHVYQRLILREALECTAARLYTGALIREHFDELMEYAVKLDAHTERNVARMNDEIVFHGSLVNLTGLQSLTREYLKAFRIGIFCMINRVPSYDREHPRKHTDMLEQLTTDDPDRAEKIVREHLWSGKPKLNNLHQTWHMGTPDNIR